jgi:hypothetical protein
MVTTLAKTATPGQVAGGGLGRYEFSKPSDASKI